MTHYTYRPWSKSGDNVQMDACVYKVRGFLHSGCVQLIIRSKNHPSQTFLVFRRLQNISNAPDNTLAKVKYKHEGLGYSLNAHGRLYLDLIPTANVMHPSFVVVDPTVLVQNFNVQTTHVIVLESEQRRLISSFFKVHGVPLTSFKENCFHNG